jgi:hypothetical protein
MVALTGGMGWAAWPSTLQAQHDAHKGMWEVWTGSLRAAGAAGSTRFSFVDESVLCMENV